MILLKLKEKLQSFINKFRFLYEDKLFVLKQLCKSRTLNEMRFCQIKMRKMQLLRSYGLIQMPMLYRLSFSLLLCSQWKLILLIMHLQLKLLVISKRISFPAVFHSFKMPSLYSYLSIIIQDLKEETIEATVTSIVDEILDKTNTNNHRWVKDFKDSVKKVSIIVSC